MLDMLPLINSYISSKAPKQSIEVQSRGEGRGWRRVLMQPSTTRKSKTMSMTGKHMLRFNAMLLFLSDKNKMENRRNLLLCSHSDIRVGMEDFPQVMVTHEICEKL